MGPELALLVEHVGLPPREGRDKLRSPLRLLQATSVVRIWRRSTGKGVYLGERKADRLRANWAWVDASAARLEKIPRQGRWNDLPGVLAGLLPQFSDIKLTKMTRTAELWPG